MASPTTMGLGAGVLSTVLAVASNLRRGDPHLVSTAPDLLTLAVIVTVIWFAVRRVRAHYDIEPLRSAQKTVVVASTVFALGMGAFTWWYLPSHAPVLGAFAAGSGFVLAYVAGFVALKTPLRTAVTHSLQ